MDPKLEPRGLLMSLVLMLGVTASGCNEKNAERPTQKSDPETPKTTEAPKKEPLMGTALADKYKACTALINDAKFDDFKKDCVEANYTAHALPGMSGAKGVDDLIGFFQSRKSAMPDWKLQPQLIMISGRNILAVILVTGTHTGTLKTPTGDLPATNKKVGQLMFHRVTINEASKATDEWAYADEPTMLSQLGGAPKGTPPKRSALEKGWDGAPIVVVTADDAKEKVNLALIKQGNDAFLANKPDELLAIYSDDITDMGQHAEKDIKGKQELAKGFTAFRNMWSDVRVSNLEAWAAGDYVVQAFKFEGQSDKNGGKNEKAGQTVRFDVAQVMHVSDGKVNQLWAF